MVTWYDKKLIERMGFSGRTCSLCKKVHETHPWAKDFYDHPFFNNNLEYLEWLSETKVK